MPSILAWVPTALVQSQMIATTNYQREMKRAAATTMMNICCTPMICMVHSIQMTLQRVFDVLACYSMVRIKLLACSHCADVLCSPEFSRLSEYFTLAHEFPWTP